MNQTEMMLPEYDREMQRTRKVLDAIPADKMDWQANDQLRTIGWNANHIADILSWTASILQEEEFDFAPVGGTPHETPSVADPKEIVAQFDQSVVDGRATLADVTDAQWSEMWSLKMGGQTLFTIPRAECMRTWVLNHIVHHRAILSVYLRMAGVDCTPVFDE